MTRPERPSTVHVVVGPLEHGVVRHGVLVAEACAQPLLRLLVPAPVEVARLGGAQVAHLSFTDRLFGRTAEQATAAFRDLVDPWVAAGVAISVTLHDLPADDSPLEVRRRAAYRDVVSRARGVVVNSWRELELAGRLEVEARSLRCIPLPVEAPIVAPGSADPSARPAPSAPAPREVVVLGFVFPDRGYEHVIDELPAGVDLRALGRPADGHEELPGALSERALERGHQMTTTGFVPDTDLPAHLAAAAVPVAPNRRVAASGSINTWTTHGRRPLVPDSPYARELELRSPGRITSYDPDRPGDLRRAVEAALADPGRTWLAPGTTVAPSPTEVADDYRRHFLACAPCSGVDLGDGRWTVPGNRWDLLRAAEPVEPAEVTVVIPYFEAQAQLDLVLTALRRQRHPATRLQVVVADDGSSEPPSVAAAAGLEVVVVRQADQGFRAAAARNLGAAAADGSVLAFLDGDTVPEPDYVGRLGRLPSLLPDAVVVGRRRHADLSAWSPQRLDAWLTGAADGPTELDEPRWLSDAYAASEDLLRVDPRSYRFVISAVLGLSADFFAEIGGFDETFRSYGGEDWDLAHRAYAAGAVLAHVRDAVAWHDGPDFAGRPEGGRPTGKNLETLNLSARIPDPVSRGGGQWRRPAIVVELAFTDPAEVLATSRAAFSQDTDCRVWVLGPEARSCTDLLGDSRIECGPVPDDVLRRALAVVRLEAPARLTGLTRLAAEADRHGTVRLPTGTIRSQRAVGRARRWARATGTPYADLALRLFGGSEVAHPLPSRPVDLAHELGAVHRAARSTGRDGLP